MENNMYNYLCEYCKGTVRPKHVAKEVFKHRDGFVILKNITIGVCDQCGNRYYSADILHRVEAIATGEVEREDEERVPVGSL